MESHEVPAKSHSGYGQGKIQRTASSETLDAVHCHITRALVALGTPGAYCAGRVGQFGSVVTWMDQAPQATWTWAT